MSKKGNEWMGECPLILSFLKIPVWMIFFLWQEREFKEALEAYNEKNKEKAMFVSKLVEVKHSVSIFFCIFCLLLRLLFFWFFFFWVWNVFSLLLKARNCEWQSLMNSAKALTFPYANTRWSASFAYFFCTFFLIVWYLLFFVIKSDFLI